MFAIFFAEGLDPFYQNIASFPTVFFTFFLGITVLFWLVAIIGLVEIDVLDFDLPSIDGMDLDGDLDVSNVNVLGGLLLRFGLGGVPITIIISLISLFGWAISYYSVHFLMDFVPGDILKFLVGIPILLVALYVATMLTAVVIKPLRPLFKKAQQETVKHILGQTAIVRTSRVDSGFGEAILEDGGAGLILKVRAIGEESYSKGDRVVLLEHVKENNVYKVVTEEEFKGI